VVGISNQGTFIAKSASENPFKIGKHMAKLPAKRDCLVHFLRLLAVWWPGAQSARDNQVLACNFAKYSPILIFFTDRLSNKPFLN